MTRRQSGSGRACPTKPHIKSCVPNINCAGKFSNWGVCDPKTRKQTRIFTQTIKREGRGRDCKTGPTSRSCIPNIDCIGTWSPWGACDRNTTTQKRTFSVSVKSEGQGKKCPTSPETNSKCIPNIDCVGRWTEWSNCDPKKMKRKREFIVADAASGTGKACPTSPIVEACIPNIDCKGTWGPWGECDFDTKKQTRIFAIEQSWMGQGKKCPPTPATKTCDPAHLHTHTHDPKTGAISIHKHVEVPVDKNLCITPKQINQSQTIYKYFVNLLGKSKCVDKEALDEATKAAKPDLLKAAAIAGEDLNKAGPYLEHVAPYFKNFLAKTMPSLKTAYIKAGPELEKAFVGPEEEKKVLTDKKDDVTSDKGAVPKWGDTKLRQKGLYRMANRGLIKRGAGACPNGCQPPQYDNSDCTNAVIKGKSYRKCSWISEGGGGKNSCKGCGAILLPKNNYGFARTRPGLFDNKSMKSALANAGGDMNLSGNANYIRIGKNFMNELAQTKDFSLPYITPTEFKNIGRIVSNYKLHRGRSGKNSLTREINNVLNTSNFPTKLLKYQGSSAGGGSNKNNLAAKAASTITQNLGPDTLYSKEESRLEAKSDNRLGGAKSAYKKNYKPVDPRNQPRPYDSAWNVFQK